MTDNMLRAAISS